MGVYIEQGKYKVRVRINGKLIRRLIGPVNPDNRRKADAVLREIKNEIAASQLRGQSWEVIEKLEKAKHQPLFHEAAEQFMLESRSRKPSTIVSYRSILDRYLLPRFKSFKLHEIDARQIAGFQTELVIATDARHTKGKTLSPRRVNTVMQLLRTILAHCLRDGLIKTNPAVCVKRVQEPRVKIDPLNKDELDLVLSKVDVHFQPLLELLAFTGMRPNEAIALRWKDIDFRRKEINIDKGRVRGNEGLPKSESAHRVLPMVPRCEAALRKQHSRGVASIDAYVFTDRKGQPIQKHLDRIWKKALIQAQVRHRPSYQLRHTFASQCLLEGLSPGYVAKLLGHSTLETMYRHYARWIDDASRANEEKLMAAFSTQPSLIEQVSPKVSFVSIAKSEAALKA